MPLFTYRAYDQNGKLTRGQLEAVSREAGLASLHGNGLIPLDFDVATARAKAPWWDRDVFSGGAMPAASLMLFTRELATLVKADLPVDEALKIISVQPLLPVRVRRVADALHQAVRGGESLAGALSDRGAEFPEYFWRLIQAGETSGSLGETTDDLATFLERAGESRSKLVSALIYPMVLFAAAIAAVTVVMTVLLPTVVPLFKEAGAQVPPALQVLLTLQDFAADYWPLLAAAAIGAGILLMAALRNARLRSRLDRFVLRLPVAGRLVTAHETARFARTYATMSRNGVPILDALRLTGGVLRNRVFSGAIAAATESVKSGSRLSEPLLRSGIFPELSMRLLSIGEQTGQVDTMLLRVAVVFEAAMQRQMLRILTLLTPLLTLLIGGTVGALILTVMNAILSVNELAGQ
jgi:general secretion pathway protein F